jgi:ribosomal protein S18 acetylase RimI-like enzyme
MPIREATPDDAPAVRRVAEASWHAANDHVLGADAVDELLAAWYAPADLRESIERSEPPMFVATVDGGASRSASDGWDSNGEVVGFAQGGPSEDGPADAVVGRIYVHPDHWGDGHGSALLERLFDAFRTAGHEDVWLAVVADNEVGRSFYDSHGFVVHEERTVEHFGVEFDDVVLVREL